MNPIVELYAAIPDEEIKQIISEMKESDLGGIVKHDGLVRKYTNKVMEITRLSYSETLLGVQMSLLKEAAYRFTKPTPPTEEEVWQKIYNHVDIRGINLEDYKRNFSNKESGLYDALVKLFADK